MPNCIGPDCGVLIGQEERHSTRTPKGWLCDGCTVDLNDRLFAGVMPTGIGYCDTSKEVDSDYLKVAFLPFSTLDLEISVPKSPLLPLILRDAEKIQARRGETYTVSGCGQTVLLGGRK